MKESGPQWPIAASSGNWDGPSFRRYVDLSAESASDMAMLLISSYNFESDDGWPDALPECPGEGAVDRPDFPGGTPRVILALANAGLPGSSHFGWPVWYPCFRRSHAIPYIRVPDFPLRDKT